MITKDAIESAFCFFHQKQRIYQYSTLDWQKDDIEYAIGDYVDNMNKELYSSLTRNYTQVSQRESRTFCIATPLLLRNCLMP